MRVPPPDAEVRARYWMATVPEKALKTVPVLVRFVDPGTLSEPNAPMLALRLFEIVIVSASTPAGRLRIPDIIAKVANADLLVKFAINSRSF